MINDDLVFDKEAYEEHRRIRRASKKTNNAFRLLITVITAFILAILISLVFLNAEKGNYRKTDKNLKISRIDFSDIYTTFKLNKFNTGNKTIDDKINLEIESIIKEKLIGKSIEYNRISKVENFIKFSNSNEVNDVNEITKSFVCNLSYESGKTKENRIIIYNYNIKKNEKIVNIDKIVKSEKISEFKNLLETEYGLKNADLVKFILHKDYMVIYDSSFSSSVNVYYDKIEKLVTNKVLTKDNLTNYAELFKRVIDPEKPMIALTFDDGPNAATTERILNTLTKYNARATFFVLGYMIDSYPNTIKKIVEQGSQIGNHTRNHKNLNLENATTITNEINYVKNKVKEIANYDITILRPPYGNANETVKSVADCPLILWNVDTLDWQSRNANSVYKEILNYVSDGSIILMHDIYSSTADAVEMAVPELIRRGYQLVTVDELFEYKGKQKVAGQKVYNIK